MKQSALERTFSTRWKQLAPRDLPQPVSEHRFAPPRRWRFDFAFVEARVAVELEGGTHNRGRHVRPAGFQSDCEKYNRAIELGWYVLRYTSSMIKSDPAAVIEQVARVVKARQNQY